MADVPVLLEFRAPTEQAFSAFSDAVGSESEAVSQAESLLDPVAGLGVELGEELTPVPMFSTLRQAEPPPDLEAFAAPEPNPDMEAPTSVVAVRVDEDRIEQLTDRPGVIVWPNSELSLLGDWGLTAEAGLVVEAPESEPPEVAAGRVDCRPFRSASTIENIRQLLGVGPLHEQGLRGGDVIVAIIDEGVNGDEYPVDDGFVRPGAPAPGSAPITSHGSMCAADILIAAPDARLYDYPFLGVPRSGGALAMFQAVLDHRRLDGTPHLTNNSYGFTGVPPQNQFPTHEIWDLNHPLHRKVREVIASGAPALFAAGNCGQSCPSGNCQTSGIGPGKSIHASNSLVEVITVAAVNSRHERIGYSSQGPGLFEPTKPDVASYSHIFGNFGPGRPGGEAQPFDNGTSAATPVAAGVAALLLGARPGTTPAELRTCLIDGATPVGDPGWNADFGHGVIHAEAALSALGSSTE